MPRGRGGGDSAFFLPSTKSMPLYDHADDDDNGDAEIRGFRTFLRWMCLDQSDACRAAFSWLVFLLFAAAVPAFSHFGLFYAADRRPYDLVAQTSLTAAAALSFITLSALTRRYGLRRFLFLHIRADSDRVRHAYAAEIRRSYRLLAAFVVPCFAAETACKLAWYGAGAGRVPFFDGHPVAAGCTACALELASWIYRTANFFLVCVLFRLICHLHILRLQDFAAVFEEESDVEAILREHLRVRRQLKVISHRFRVFILLGMVTVTASQFATALVTLRPNSDDNLFNTGELALCSIVLVTGLFICLRSAAKITHKAQALTSHATKWHICATLESFAVDRPSEPVNMATTSSAIEAEEEDDEEGSSEKDELEGTKVLYPHAHTISFQKRQALVTYLENNRAGITIFGFTMDRAWLHTIFMLEVVLFLWLLGKTVGIS
ncbi:uncharacterized protein LOC122046715 [Zingiber officinale]|uniref:uncharacterized protein LOC122046715 n=1 Tax=Zingiber officinale TaxID=94328 RepID=UPI001C4D068B|nr:uncharacterized protein LOC122046715 [Zingiber officinale]